MGPLLTLYRGRSSEGGPGGQETSHLLLGNVVRAPRIYVSLGLDNNYGKRGYNTGEGGGGACEVLPLRKGGDGKGFTLF